MVWPGHRKFDETLEAEASRQPSFDRRITAIVNGEQPSPNFRDGWITELVADAILKSGETQVWVNAG